MPLDRPLPPLAQPWEVRVLRAWPTIVLLGTVVRFLYGWQNRLWNGAPDQLAWGLVLDDMVASGSWSYSQLIHYPHEGGSVLLSLLSLPFRPLAGIMPPLSWAALVADSLARAIQIRVATRHFAPRTAVLFSLWTVLSVPLILPWATVDFGLHSLTAFAPFLLLHMASGAQASPWKVGVLCGGCVVLAYDCLVLIPAYACWLALQGPTVKDTIKRGGRFLLGCSALLVPHVLIRAFVDDGFHLEGQLSILTIRGLDWGHYSWATMIDLLTTLHTTLPASVLLSTFPSIAPRLLALVVLAFLLVGLLFSWIGKRPKNDSLSLTALVVLWFTIAYGTGPLFTDRVDVTGYFHYRHLCFIAPLLVLWMLDGFVRIGRYGAVLGIVWLGLCGAASITFMHRTQRCALPNSKATGWVVARKYGDRPAHLLRMLDVAPHAQHNDLLYGYGWGIAAALFEDRAAPDPAALATLENLWIQFPANTHPMVWNGIEQAFQPGITPDLDEGFLPLLRERMR